MVKSKTSLSDVAEYEQHIKYINKTYSSQKWSFTSLDSLLDATSALCRKWIKEDCPTVKQVLLKFPCLQEHKLVSYQGCNIRQWGGSFKYNHVPLISQSPTPFVHEQSFGSNFISPLVMSDQPYTRQKWSDLSECALFRNLVSVGRHGPFSRLNSQV